jgi:hypothetical protein
VIGDQAGPSTRFVETFLLLGGELPGISYQPTLFSSL